MARLDRLVTAKGIAQMGATIGRQFSYELLQAVSQLDDTTLQRELGKLVEAELIYQRGVSPNATYLFKHALVQDTAYESLLRSTRQGYHRRVAEVLEERFLETVESQPELLAHHFTEAGLHEPAVDYWYKAGQHASERSAHREATSHLHKGLVVLATLPETSERAQHELRFYLTLHTSLCAIHGYASSEVSNCTRCARELCQHVGDPGQFYTMLSGMRNFHLVRADLQTARELSEQVLSLVQRDPQPAWCRNTACSGISSSISGSSSSPVTRLSKRLPSPPPSPLSNPCRSVLAVKSRGHPPSPGWVMSYGYWAIPTKRGDGVTKASSALSNSPIR